MMDYMPYFIIGIATLFLVPFFISVVRGVKKDKGYAGRPVVIAQLAKQFGVLDGRQVVAFPVSLYREPNKASAILSAMTPGTVISDGAGNEYIVEDFLKNYAHSRYIFRDSMYHLVFAVRATGRKSAVAGVELSLKSFNAENARRKAAVKAGTLSREEYTEWLRACSESLAE